MARRILGSGAGVFAFLIVLVHAAGARGQAAEVIERGGLVRSFKETLKILNTKIDIKNFQGKMPFSKFMEQLQDQFSRDGKKVNFLLDRVTFPKAPADRLDILQTEVMLTASSKKMAVAVALSQAVAQVGKQINKKVDFLLANSGFIEITTLEEPAYLETFLQVEFSRRPLALALNDLSVVTGVNIVVDPRANKKAQTRVTARFPVGTKADTMLLLLTDMAGLKHVAVDDVVYVTTPAHARILEEEQAKKKPEKK